MYGVDQCRMCGAPIEYRDPKKREAQEMANRRSTMPEAEWRAQGFLTPPTKYQINTNPADGCCRECGKIVLRRRWHYGRRIAFGFGIMALTLFVILKLVNYMKH